MMKPVLIALCATSVVALSACADDSSFYRPHYAGVTDYDAYYDDFYGPFYDGYWAPGGNYFYRTGPRGRFREDRAMHFHHEGGVAGMHAVHGMPSGAPRAFGGGGARGGGGRH
jgi:hypothetical protein